MNEQNIKKRLAIIDQRINNLEMIEGNILQKINSLQSKRTHLQNMIGDSSPYKPKHQHTVSDLLKFIADQADSFILDSKQQ